MAETNDKAAIQATLTQIWGRTRPLILSRVTAVELAVAALSEENPDLKALEAGRAEAHKLAGVLGTFGLDRGTELARELEARLGAGGTADGTESTDLAAELRAVIESAGPGEPGA